MKQILKKIWTDKGILFLVLMVIYMVPAFFLNGYYKQVILAGKTYEKFGYTLILTGEKGDNYLSFEVKDCPESSDEPVNKGDTIAIDQNYIYCGKDAYYYGEDYRQEGQFLIDLPNGRTYQYDTQAEKEGILLDQQSRKAPDNYKPKLLCAAFGAYQKYMKEGYDVHCSAGKYFRWSAVFWFLGTVWLCLMNYLIEFRMWVFSQSIFIHTTENMEFLEPSLWIKIKFAVGAILLYGVSVAGLVTWCYRKGFAG